MGSASLISTSVVRLRYPLILVWALLTVLAISWSARVGEVIRLDLPAAGPTESTRAQQTLEAAFADPGTDLLAVAVSRPSGEGSARRDALLDSLAAVAARQGFAKDVVRPLDPAWRRTANGDDETFFVVSLRLEAVDRVSDQVPAFREALARVLARNHLGYTVSVTGMPALERDAEEMASAMPAAWSAPLWCRPRRSWSWPSAGW